MTSVSRALRGSEDTIAAIATAPGRGALALVRLGGPRVLEVAARVIRPWPLADRRATLVALHHPETGALVERPVVVVYEGTRSYTGEPMVEIVIGTQPARRTTAVRYSAREGSMGFFYPAPQAATTSSMASAVS